MKVLSKKFEENIASRNFSPDAAQKEVVEVLSVLQNDLLERTETDTSGVKKSELSRIHNASVSMQT